MLRSLLRLFASPVSPQEVPQPQTEVMDTSDSNTSSASRLTVLENTATAIPSPAVSQNHRERVLSMKLVHAKLCSPRRCERLAGLGIETIGDLASCDPGQVAASFEATKKADRVIKQYRRAVRLSASVPGLLPHDALLLVSIHRRSVRGLSMESPGILHRDLERFAESSKGRSQLRGRRLPSVRRIKKWIAESEAVRCPSIYTRAA